jgi:hypothetical protein
MHGHSAYAFLFLVHFLYGSIDVPEISDFSFLLIHFLPVATSAKVFLGQPDTESLLHYFVVSRTSNFSKQLHTFNILLYVILDQFVARDCDCLHRP